MRWFAVITVLAAMLFQFLWMRVSASRYRHAETGAGEHGTLKVLLLGAWLGTDRDRRNQVAIVGWATMFVASLSASAFVLKVGLVGSTVLKWAIGVLLMALFVRLLLTFLRFLRELDELARRIQLEGLAVGFGAGFGFACMYPILAIARVSGFDPSEGFPIMLLVMSCGYPLGTILASKRYR